jgi:hypothetical protein
MAVTVPIEGLLGAGSLALSVELRRTRCPTAGNVAQAAEVHLSQHTRLAHEPMSVVARVSALTSLHKRPAEHFEGRMSASEAQSLASIGEPTGVEIRDPSRPSQASGGTAESGPRSFPRMTNRAESTVPDSEASNSGSATAGDFADASLNSTSVGGAQDPYISMTGMKVIYFG